VPPFVCFFVEGRGETPVRFRRDYRGYVLLIESRPQPVGIESAVGKQVVGTEPLDQIRHGAQVMRLPGHKPEVDEVAPTVSQRQYFGGDTAARAPYGLAESPPLAPWPERWTLTIEPSIIAYSRSGADDNALNML